MSECRDLRSVFFLPRCLSASRLHLVTGKLHGYRAKGCYIELELIRHQDFRCIMHSSMRCSVASSGYCAWYEKSKRKHCNELPWPVTSHLQMWLLSMLLLCCWVLFLPCLVLYQQRKGVSPLLFPLLLCPTFLTQTIF